MAPVSKHQAGVVVAALMGGWPQPLIDFIFWMMHCAHSWEE